MRNRHRFVAGVASALAVIVFGVAAPQGAAAQEGEHAAVRFTGTWALVSCVVTKADIDPADPTAPFAFEFKSVSQISGDFVGFDYTEGTGTFDPITGDAVASFTDTFHGRYQDGSTGTMTLEGTSRIDGETTESRINRWIVGGTIDFEGARGHWPAVGAGVSCVPAAHHGTYEGVWARP